MAIYLTLFWFFIFVFFITYLIVSLTKVRKPKQIIDDYGGLYFIFLGAFILIAIIKNDPIEFFNINIPTELQWLGSLLAFGFGSWKFYLNPLKKKVYGMDREIGEVKAYISTVKDDVKLIKERIINGKIRIKKYQGTINL